MGLYQDIVEIIGNCELRGAVGEYSVARSDIGEAFSIYPRPNTGQPVCIGEVTAWGDIILNDDGNTTRIIDLRRINEFAKHVQKVLELEHEAKGARPC